MKRLGLIALTAAAYATLYVLMYWGILSLWGAPSFTHHHLTEYLILVGIFVWLGYWAGKRDGDR